MKVRLEQDDQLTEPEVVLRVPKAQTAAVADLKRQLAALDDPTQQLAVRWQGSLVRVPVGTILFCEATGHRVMVHTAQETYATRGPLYQLADQLPSYFYRGSKSAVLNLHQVASLSKSLTGNLVTFQRSLKQLYVSRRYYGELKRALEGKGSVT